MVQASRALWVEMQLALHFSSIAGFWHSGSSSSLPRTARPQPEARPTCLPQRRRERQRTSWSMVCFPPRHSGLPLSVGAAQVGRHRRGGGRGRVLRAAPRALGHAARGGPPAGGGQRAQADPADPAQPARGQGRAGMGRDATGRGPRMELAAGRLASAGEREGGECARYGAEQIAARDGEQRGQARVSSAGDGRRRW